MSATRRIVVALDSAVDSAALLEAAAVLAARSAAELVVVFVEDADLLTLAALPFSREIARYPASVRAMDPERIQRAMQRQQREIERLLESVSGPRQIPWSVQVARGRYLVEALARAAASDVLMLRGRLETAAGTTGRIQAGEGGRPVRPRRIIALLDDETASERVLDAASAWLGAAARELQLLLPAGAWRPEAVGRLERRLVSLGAEFGSFRHRVDTVTGGEEVMTLLRARRCGLLVAARGGRWLSAEDMSRLREEANFPLVLVGQARDE